MSLSGKMVHFPDDFRHKVVMLGFWDSHGGSVYTNHLGAYQKYHERGLDMLIIQVDSDTNAMQKFANDAQLGCPIVFDGGWSKGPICKTYTANTGLLILVDGSSGVVFANNRQHDLLGGYLATNLLAEVDKALSSAKQ